MEEIKKDLVEVEESSTDKEVQVDVIGQEHQFTLSDLLLLFYYSRL